MRGKFYIFSNQHWLDDYYQSKLNCAMGSSFLQSYVFLFIVSQAFHALSIRIKEIDRKTSGKSGKDACTLSLALDWDQYEEVCPIRQLATLKKQISDAKRMIKNSTYLEHAYQRGLQEEKQIRETLTRRVEALHAQVCEMAI